MISHAPLDPFIGRSSAIRGLAEEALRAATAESPVLILGESGSGKGVLADWIHGYGPRRHRPLVKINCAELSPELVESELFGHTHGAFTGAVQARPGLIEAAEGGMLFLDEVGDLDPGVQGKLLRVIEEKRFRRIGESRERAADVRFLTATCQNIEPRAGRRRFRVDLYYRISTFTLRVPPLRDRREDIPLLVESIVRSIAARTGAPVPPFAAPAMRALADASWPGNIRELINVLERTLHMTGGEVVERGALRFDLRPEHGALDGGGGLELRRSERAVIVRALEEERGNVARTAKRLGMGRSTLYTRLREFGLTAEARKRRYPR